MNFLIKIPDYRISVNQPVGVNYSGAEFERIAKFRFATQDALQKLCNEMGIELTEDIYSAQRTPGILQFTAAVQSKEIDAPSFAARMQEVMNEEWNKSLHEKKPRS